MHKYGTRTGKYPIWECMISILWNSQVQNWSFEQDFSLMIWTLWQRKNLFIFNLCLIYSWFYDRVTYQMTSMRRLTGLVCSVGGMNTPVDRRVTVDPISTLLYALLKWSFIVSYHLSESFSTPLWASIHFRSTVCQSAMTALTCSEVVL